MGAYKPQQVLTGVAGGASPSYVMGIGEMFGLLRKHPEGLTKSELARLSGLSRTTINQRLDVLQTAGLLSPAAQEAWTGGRPADRFLIDGEGAFILVADMGASGLRVALCDIHANVVAERSEDFDITAGPMAVLTRVQTRFLEILAGQARTADDVIGIGIDVPGPVDHASGRVVTPPIMTGWHDFDVPGFFTPQFGGLVSVEKDVNAMAFGEHRLSYPEIDDLVFVKVGTGIGTGIIATKEIYRGADGAAGDIGHIQIGDDLDGARPMCRCGRLGCVEAYAGGWAIQRDLRMAGVEVASVRDVVRLIQQGHPEATRLYRRAATTLGSAISDIVNLVNPRVLVIGGQLATVDDLLFAAVREVVYRRSLPLATRNLQIVPSRLGAHVGIHGLARLVLDDVYDSRRIEAFLDGSR